MERWLPVRLSPEAGPGEAQDGRRVAHLAATPLAARGWSELAHLSSFFWSTLSRMFFRSTRARLSSPLHTRRKTSSISSFKISSVNSTRLKGQGPCGEGQGCEHKKRTGATGSRTPSRHLRHPPAELGNLSWEESQRRSWDGCLHPRVPGVVPLPFSQQMVTGAG